MPLPWSASRAVGVALILAPILALILALPSRATTSTELERRLEELRAAGAAEEALALVEGSAAGERVAPAALARWRHRLLVELERTAEAERAGHAWVAAAAAAGDPADELEAALEVARFLAGRGKRAEAAGLLEQRLELAETAGPDRRLELWLELANSWTSSGRYVEAESMLEEAEAAGREIGLSTAQRMALLEAWGNLHFFRLEPKLALGYREEAARLALDGGRPADAARLYTDLGLTRIQLHDHGAAVADLERAANLIDEPTDGRRLPILYGLGVAALELHRLDDAERAFTEFTAEAERLGNRRLLSVGVGELGLVALERGDVEGAVAAFDVAIAHARAARDLGNEVAWWMNRGKARRDQGRFEEALVSYREAEELVARLPGRVEAALFKHVGQCHAGLGDDVRALSSFARALEIAERSGDRKVLWETQRELGRLHRRRGDPARAEASYLAALDALESLRSGLRIESFKTDFFQSKVQVYDEALELIAARETDGAERSFEIAERARARAFLDTLALTSTDLHQTLPPALREEERRLLDRISALQGELRSGGKGETGDLLAAAESELEALAARVDAERPRYRAMQHVAPSTMAEVRSALAPGELLLAYHLGSTGSHLWVVGADGVERHALASREQIESAVLEAYAALAAPTGGELSPNLGELLLGAAADRLRSARGLVVVPSGALFYLPFEVLAEPGSAVPIGERLPVTYVPSGSVLVELRRREPSAPRSRSPRALVVADPATGVEAVSASRGTPIGAVSQLGRLPFTRREARTLRRLFGAGRTVVLTGEQATEERLLAQDLASFSLLHLGSHGVIDAEQPARSALVLSPPGPEGSSDGLLLPREIVRLALDAELVTLSACQSALGSVVSGEGMVSLARSFFYAGTPAVVASLWSVNDRASATLMESFYRSLSTGASRAQALREAKAAMRSRARYRHPYYWAGFVLLGDGEGGVAFPERAARAAPGGALLLLGLGAAALAAGIASLRRWPPVSWRRRR